MSQSIVMSADLTTVDRIPADGFVLESANLELSTEIAALYQRVHANLIPMSNTEALAEIEVSFAGEYGRLDLTASLLARSRPDLVGAVLTVWDAPWPDVPRGPFVIDLFVDPAWQSRGVGRTLMSAAMDALALQGAEGVALRVETSNIAACNLYSKLGFEVQAAPSNS